MGHSGHFNRVIRLANGLTACLISDSSPAPAPEEDEVDSAEETGSEVESESEGQASNTGGEEEDDSMPKRTHNDEQKMVGAPFVLWRKRCKKCFRQQRVCVLALAALVIRGIYPAWHTFWNIWSSWGVKSFLKRMILTHSLRYLKSRRHTFL